MPISIPLLKEICTVTNSICFSEFKAILFKTAFVLAFFGAMRISELLPKNKGSSLDLLKHHVLVYRSGINICIPSSKTDSAGKGVWISLYSCGDVEICPLRIVNDYMLIRSFSEGPFWLI